MIKKILGKTDNDISSVNIDDVSGDDFTQKRQCTATNQYKINNVS